MNNRKYQIFFCSDRYFESKTKSIKEDNFADIIRNHDMSKDARHNFNFEPASLLIINSNDYLGIVPEANLRLYDLIIDITQDDADIYIQNPTDTFIAKIQENIPKENYSIVNETLSFLNPPVDYPWHEQLHGEVAEEIIKCINLNYYLNNNVPLVILLYGKSGVGKTHAVLDVSKHLTKQKPLRLQLSNYQNIENLNELFGESIASDDLVFKLMKRNTNIVLLDEFDKTNPLAYNSFYRLFDESNFNNRYRTTKVSDLIIFCTTNYSSIQEIEKNLPSPIFNRIDKFIYVPGFTYEQLVAIIDKELTIYINNLNNTDIKTYVSGNIDKIKNEIYEELYDFSENQLDYRIIKKFIMQTLENYVYQYIKTIKQAKRTNR